MDRKKQRQDEVRSDQVLCAVYKNFNTLVGTLPISGKGVYGEMSWGGKMKKKSKQVYKETTKLVRIDAELHQLLKVKAAESSMSIKGLLEECAAEILAVEEKRK